MPLTKSKFVQYYVEGKDEEKLIHVLKSDLCVIRSGKVQRLNVIEHLLTDAQLMTLRVGTMVVLIFDTDTQHTNILSRNLEKLNLEDESVRSCDIKKITELLDSKSNKDFKSDFIQANNLANKLREHQFDINRLWNKQPFPPYQNIINKAKIIKLSV